MILEALRFSSEELIRDARRWCEPGHALPYSTVTEFRTYLGNAVREDAEGRAAVLFDEVLPTLLPSREAAVQETLRKWGQEVVPQVRGCLGARAQGVGRRAQEGLGFGLRKRG